MGQSVERKTDMTGEIKQAPQGVLFLPGGPTCTKKDGWTVEMCARPPWLSFPPTPTMPRSADPFNNLGVGGGSLLKGTLEHSSLSKYFQVCGPYDYSPLPWQSENSHR